MESNEVLLTVVTVVFNDAAGLLRTIASMASLPAMDHEHVIIDGSTDLSCQEVTKSLASDGREVVIEPDDGIYDAMNKGLLRAKGDYVLFMNAGDQFHRDFDIEMLRLEAKQGHRLVLGYAIEEYATDRYLHPGLGRESSVFRNPPHQATFYPKEFYEQARYRVDVGLGADGLLTHACLDARGGVFLPTVVSRFELGGVSSTYDQFPIVWQRIRRARRLRRIGMIGKVVLYWLLPRRLFYRLLASYKYTKLPIDGPDPALLAPDPLPYTSVPVTR